MDTLDNLIFHLPKETRHLFKKLCSVEDYRSDLREVKEFLEQQLHINPYPTLQVLRYHSTLHYIKSEELVYKALLKRLQDHEESHDEDAECTAQGKSFHKLLNLVANFDAQNHKTDICNALNEKLKSLSGVERHEFILSLLARPSIEVLLGILEIGVSEIPLLSKQAILQQAICKHEHFVKYLICSEIDSIRLLKSRQGQIIGIVKLVRVLSTANLICKKDFSFPKDLLVDLDSYTETDEASFVDTLYYDLKRLANIFDMLRKYMKYDIPLSRLITAPFLDLLFKHTKFLSMDFSIASRYVRTNKTLLDKILKVNSSSNTEHDILVAYQVLSQICNSYLMDRTDENYITAIEANLAIITNGIRTINDHKIRIRLLGNIYTILFLRWENISENAIVGDSAEIRIACSASREIGKRGFVCNKFLLEKLLKTIGTAIVEQFTDVELDASSSLALQNLRQAVDDAFWRLSCLVKDGVVQSPIVPRQTSVLRLEPILPSFHEEFHELNSSDDEHNGDNAMRKTRKLKRRRSTGTRSVLESSRRSSGPLKDAVTVAAGKRNDEVGGIIPKMLGNPLDLAIAALSRDDVVRVKEIIKRFNINNAKLSTDISFLENLRYLKSQLAKTIARYKEQDQQLKSISTIERIKKVAAIGFETSRITNIIEDFTQANPLVTEPKSSETIEKFSKLLPFLHQYEDQRIQLSTIVDLLVDLNMNHELCSNLWSMTNRRYGTGRMIDELNSQQSMFRTLGPIGFFNTTVECLHLFKTINGENIGAKDMLLKSSFTFRSDVLKHELEQEEAFRLLFGKIEDEVDTVADLKVLGRCLEDPKAKTNYYSRFTHYLGSMLKLLLTARPSFQDRISELVRMDSKQIIGELLFEHKMSSVDVEQLVMPLNMNLVHTIAVNVYPIVVRKKYGEESPRIYEYKDEGIVSYVARHNPLLGYVLQQISNSDQKIAFMSSQYLYNAINLPEVKTLASLFDDNPVVAALLFDRLDVAQFSPKKHELIAPIYKAIQEVFHKSQDLVALKDDAICKEIRKDITQIALIECVSDLNMRSHVLVDNIIKITDAELATNLIQSILLDDDIDRLDSDCKRHLEEYRNDIRIFSQVAKDFSFSTWCAAHIFAENSPDSIMKKLIKLKKYKLCYEWWEIHKNSINQIDLRYFHEVFFDSLIQTGGGKQIRPHLLKIIESFPSDQVVGFFQTNIEKFKNLPVLNYAINYLIEHRTNGTDGENDCDAQLKYRNYQVSLKLFEHLTWEECEQNWNLLSRPLLIIEQFVMNSKFEMLSKILASIRPLLATSERCKYCEEHRVVYDIPKNSSITLGSSNSSAFILLNFNLYQRDHAITIECIDKLLQIYATKALDYKIKETPTTNDADSPPTELASLDSLCGAFMMPKDAPPRYMWIKDEDAVHCMCCKRAIFTMLTRRHHCRRCGRVVCYSCSLNRMKIPSLYQDIAVRVCNDCYGQTRAIESKQFGGQKVSESESSTDDKNKKKSKQTDWQLSGNLTHDKLLREEFGYEHAPSAHLCLTIMSFHSSNDDYVSLLLYHCRKFENLLRPQRSGYPNPEIDYALVARMLNSLALAAKVRGGPTDCDVISDHSAIIIAVVKEGCEAHLPMESLNSVSLRKLGDSLVLAEKWDLAKDIYVKCNQPTAGVMAVHGLASLRVGRYETAREQLRHCMTSLCKSRDLANIIKFITTDQELDLHCEIDIPVIRRPARSPPLLYEAIKVIESTGRHVHVPETLARADSIRNSNTSLASNKSKAKDKIPILDPALNIINTISNLKKISQGNYLCETKNESLLDNKSQLQRNSLIFEESLFYLLSYGSHVDIVNFLVRHEQTMCALRYFLLQNLDNDIFIRNIYVKHLRHGKVDQLIKQMQAVDMQLSIWKDAIIQTCRYLETKNLLNSLYHLQNLLNDPIRASMTCVKFYSMNCMTFRDLQNNSFHLINAQKHLQSELEMCQWENINLSKQRMVKEPSFLMQMDAKTLNGHINTILRQMEVTKFLAKAEQDEKLRRSTRQVLKQIGVEGSAVPTLFDSIQEKIQICILVLLCGSNIEEGFGLAYRIIQDYNLPVVKIYGTTAKYLARNNRLDEVEKLINCIKGNNGTGIVVYDKILSLAIQAATNTHMSEIKTMLDNLIKLIVDIETKISCHIYVGQLKSAYLLAVQHNRLNDVKNILRHAEAGNQLHIKRLCEKKLNINPR